jgi:hypothetical protein
MAEDLHKRFTVKIDSIKVYNDKSLVAFSQGDVKTAILIIELTENDKALDLTGKKVRAAFRKADGKNVMQDQTTGVSITDAIGGKVQVVLSTQVLAAKGNVRGQLSITDEAAGLVAETVEFGFTVRESLLNSSIVSLNELPIVEKMIDAADVLGEIDLQTIVGNTENVNSLKSEVETARGTAGNLSGRFSSIESSVAQTQTIKADKTYVDQKMTGTPKIIKATLSELTTAYPTGSTELALVTADGFLYQWVTSAWTKMIAYQSTGIANKSLDKPFLTTNVTQEILGQKVLAQNELTFVDDKVISTVDGVIGNNTSARYYEANVTGAEKINIPVISFSRTDRGYAFYDVNGTFISGQHAMSYSTSVVTMIDVVVPPNAAIVRFDLLKTNTFNYITLYFTGDNLYSFKKIKAGSEVLPVPIEAPRYLNFENKNLYNKDSSENLFGYNIGSSGSVGVSAGWMVTHYIEVEGGNSYTFFQAGIDTTSLGGVTPVYYQTYDSNKKSLNTRDTLANNTVTLGSTVKYVRFTFYVVASVSEFPIMFCKGTFVKQPYTKNGYNFKQLNLTKDNIPANFYGWYGTRLTTIGDSNTTRRMWQKYIVKKFGLVYTQYNLVAEGGQDASYFANEAKLSLIPKDTDIFTLMLGTNTGASNGALPAENIPITYQWDTTTYAGAMGYIISYLSTHFPYARIILMSPPYAGNKSSPTEYYTAGIYEKIDILKELAQRYGCEFINIYSEMGANMYNFGAFFPDVGDGVHFGDIAGRRIARKIINKMLEIEPIDYTDITAGHMVLSATTANLAVSGTVTITANHTENVTWVSSNPAVATVANGVITAVASGTATITATNRFGYSSTVAVTVS